MGHRRRRGPRKGCCSWIVRRAPTASPLLLAACEVSGTVAVYQLGDKALTVLPFADVEEGRWYCGGRAVRL